VHLATFHGHPKILRLLLDRRGEVDPKTYGGQTARWLAHSSAKPGLGTVSEPHAQMAKLLRDRGGSLGLPPPSWDASEKRKPIPPDEVRCNPEDGVCCTLGELMAKYVVREQMYTEEECENYFRDTMCYPSECHPAWHIPVQRPLQPGEHKYG